MQNGHSHPYEQTHESFYRARDLHRQARALEREADGLERRRARLLRIAEDLADRISPTVGVIVAREARSQDLRAIRLRQRAIWLHLRGRDHFRIGLEHEAARERKLQDLIQLTSSSS